MILNILILFLCTSCCACVDCDPDVDIFYLRIIEDGQNAVLKYNIEDSRNYRGNNNLRLAHFTNGTQNIYAGTYVEGDSINPYLAVFLESNLNQLLDGEIYTLWLENKKVGQLFIKTQSIKKAFDCCNSYKLETINSRTDSLVVTKENKNFYEVQF